MGKEEKIYDLICKTQIHKNIIVITHFCKNPGKFRAILISSESEKSLLCFSCKAQAYEPTRDCLEIEAPSNTD